MPILNVYNVATNSKEILQVLEEMQEILDDSIELVESTEHFVEEWNSRNNLAPFKYPFTHINLAQFHNDRMELSEKVTPEIYSITETTELPHISIIYRTLTDSIMSAITYTTLFINSNHSSHSVTGGAILVRLQSVIKMYEIFYQTFYYIMAAKKYDYFNMSGTMQASVEPKFIMLCTKSES